MTLIKDIYDYIDSVAPFDTQADFDNSGVLVGDRDTEVSRVLCCLDITDEVINEATALSCELIISHHPVIFAPLKSITPSSVVYKLIKADLSALCVHTNLDKAADIGVNAMLSKQLGLTDTTLYPEDYLCVGRLSSAMTDEEFARYVKDKLCCNGVRYTNSDSITTVAVSSGAGSEAVTLNKKYAFDALVTGELKHHHFLYAQENSLCAVEAGHFNTEDVVISPLCDLLSNHFDDVCFIKSESLSDPVKFA